MTQCLVIALLALSMLSFAESRTVLVGERNLSIECTGTRGAGPAVILLAGGGRTSADWVKVQSEVAKFTRVCSYDRAGLGKSEKTAIPQNTPEVIADLHALLNVADEKPPYILVGHSIAGVYERRYADKYPNEVAAFVFVDSSHEEQVLRFHEIAPDFATLGGADAARMGLLTKAGEKSTWYTDRPVIVLARGQATPKGTIPNLTEAQTAQIDQAWQEMQHDLAKRSSKGEYRQGLKSGHYVHRDEPELVIAAIRELCTK